jgi:hypothetical protein
MAHYLKVQDHEQRYRKGPKQKNRRVTAKHGNQSKLFMSTMARLPPFESKRELNLEQSSVGILAYGRSKAQTKPDRRRPRAFLPERLQGFGNATDWAAEEIKHGELQVVTDEVQKRQRLQQQQKEKQQKLFTRISTRSVHHSHRYTRSLQELQASREGELEDAVLAVAGVTDARVALKEAKVYVKGEDADRLSIIAAINHVGFDVSAQLASGERKDSYSNDTFEESRREEVDVEEKGAAVCAALCASRVKNIAGLKFSVDEVDRIVLGHFRQACLAQQQGSHRRGARLNNPVAGNEVAKAVTLHIIGDGTAPEPMSGFYTSKAVANKQRRHPASSFRYMAAR